MKEALEGVRGAEQEAKSIVAEAEKEAKAIIAEASKNGEAFIKMQKGKGKKKAKNSFSRQKPKPLKRLRDFKKEYQEKVKYLRKISADKMNIAVDMILERIVEVLWQ